MSNQKVTAEDVPGILGRTKLSDEQEALLEEYFPGNDEKKRNARLDYHLNKMSESDPEFRKNYLTHVSKFTKKVHEELTEAGNDLKLSEGQREWVKKLGLSENAVRNHKAEEQDEWKRDKGIVKETKVWDSILQKYIPKTEYDERRISRRQV